MSKKSLRKIWQNYESQWIKNHPRIRRIRDCWIWFEFHFARGKNFWNTVIDYIKTVALVIIAAGIYKPLSFILEPAFLWTFVIGMIVFFVVWSQVLDLLKYQEAKTSFDNKRTWFVREYILPLKRQLNKIEKDLAAIKKDLELVRLWL